MENPFKEFGPATSPETAQKPQEVNPFAEFSTPKTKPEVNPFAEFHQADNNPFADMPAVEAINATPVPAGLDRPTYTPDGQEGVTAAEGPTNTFREVQKSIALSGDKALLDPLRQVGSMALTPLSAAASAVGLDNTAQALSLTRQNIMEGSENQAAAGSLNPFSIGAPRTQTRQEEMAPAQNLQVGVFEGYKNPTWWAVNLASIIPQVGVQLAATAAGGPVGFALAAAIPSWNSTYRETYDEMVRTGHTPQEAMIAGNLEGLANGVVEYLTSKMSFGLVKASDPIVKDVARNAVLDAVKQYGYAGLAESGQGMVSEIGQIASRALRQYGTGDKVDVGTAGQIADRIATSGVLEAAGGVGFHGIDTFSGNRPAPAPVTVETQGNTAKVQAQTPTGTITGIAPKSEAEVAKRAQQTQDLAATLSERQQTWAATPVQDSINRAVDEVAKARNVDPATMAQAIQHDTAPNEQTKSLVDYGRRLGLDVVPVRIDPASPASVVDGWADGATKGRVLVNVNRPESMLLTIGLHEASHTFSPQDQQALMTIAGPEFVAQQQNQAQAQVGSMGFNVSPDEGIARAVGEISRGLELKDGQLEAKLVAAEQRSPGLIGRLYQSLTGFVQNVGQKLGWATKPAQGQNPPLEKTMAMREFLLDLEKRVRAAKLEQTAQALYRPEYRNPSVLTKPDANASPNVQGETVDTTTGDVIPATPPTAQSTVQPAIEAAPVAPVQSYPQPNLSEIPNSSTAPTAEQSSVVPQAVAQPAVLKVGDRVVKGNQTGVIKSIRASGNMVVNVDGGNPTQSKGWAKAPSNLSTETSGLGTIEAPKMPVSAPTQQTTLPPTAATTVPPPAIKPTRQENAARIKAEVVARAAMAQTTPQPTQETVAPTQAQPAASTGNDANLDRARQLVKENGRVTTSLLQSNMGIDVKEATRLTKALNAEKKAGKFSITPQDDQRGKFSIDNRTPSGIGPQEAIDLTERTSRAARPDSIARALTDWAKDSWAGRKDAGMTVLQTPYGIQFKYPFMSGFYETGQKVVNGVSRLVSQISEVAPTILPGPTTGNMVNSIINGPRPAEADLVSKLLTEGNLVNQKPFTTSELLAHPDVSKLDPKGQKRVVKAYMETRAAVEKTLDDKAKNDINNLVRASGEEVHKMLGVNYNQDGLERRVMDGKTTAPQLIREIMTKLEKAGRTPADPAPDPLPMPDFKLHDRVTNGKVSGDVTEMQGLQNKFVIEDTKGNLHQIGPEWWLSGTPQPDYLKSPDQVDKLMSELKNTGDTLKRLKDEGYWPLSRYGRYYVDVLKTDEDGNKSRVSFPTFESQSQRDRALADVKKYAQERFPNQELEFETGTISKEQYKLYESVDPATFALLVDKVEQGLGVDVSDEMRQLLLKVAVSDRSASKHLLERIGIAGFSQDFRRVLADFATSNARSIVRSLYSEKMRKQIEGFPKTEGEMKDYATRQLEYLNNWGDENQYWRGHIVNWTLLGSVVGGGINMLSLGQLTLPHLTEVMDSPVSASNNILRAMNAFYPTLIGSKVPPDVRFGKMIGNVSDSFTPNEKRLQEENAKSYYDQAKQDGKIDPQDIYNIKGMAEGQNTLQPMIRQGGPARQAAQIASTFLGRAFTRTFAYPESISRQVAFMAGYRAGMVKGVKNGLKGDALSAYAYKIAIGTVDQSNSAANRGNRPEAFRGPVGATAGMYKQFLVHMLEFYGRLGKLDPQSPWNMTPQQEWREVFKDPNVRQAFLKKIGGFANKPVGVFLGVLLALAGAEELPFYQDATDFWDTLLQSFGYEGNTKKFVREAVKPMLGEYGTDLFLHGLPNAFGINIGNRIGLGNILPGTDTLNPSNKDKLRSLAEFAGPGGGVVQNQLQAVQAFQENRYADAFGKASPKAVSDLLSGTKMMATGKAVNAQGDTVTDVSPVAGFGKALGLNPKAVSDIQRQTREAGQEKDRIEFERKKITDRMQRAFRNDDKAGVQSAIDDLKKWNDENPTLAVDITPQSFEQMARNAGLNQKERFDRLKPASMREGYLPKPVEEKEILATYDILKDQSPEEEALRKAASTLSTRQRQGNKLSGRERVRLKRLNRMVNRIAKIRGRQREGRVSRASANLRARALARAVSSLSKQ